MKTKNLIHIHTIKKSYINIENKFGEMFTNFEQFLENI